MVKKLEPISVGFVEGGAEICVAIESLGYVAGTIGGGLLFGDRSDPNVRLIAVNLATPLAGTKLIVDVQDKLRAAGHAAIADNLGPFAVVGADTGTWWLVFLAWPGEFDPTVTPPPVH